jgi:hypothetical protein
LSPPRFDAYVMVDWSAESRPKTGANSVWYAVVVRHGGKPLAETPVNPATRAEARDALADRLAAFVADGRRVLVGLDFPFGYPAGLAAMLGLGGPPWRATWDALAAAIDDRPSNANNRFAVASELNRLATGGPFPFWGCPAAQATDFLAPTRPKAGWGERFPAEFRAAEGHAEGASSPWKCCYTGSVGGQALVGIPVVRALRDDPRLAAATRVWPFETGLAPLPAEGPRVVLAEVYPSMLKLAGDASMVKDARQVTALARRFAALDDAGALAARFGPPEGLTAEARRRAETEEGWILAP